MLLRERNSNASQKDIRAIDPGIFPAFFRTICASHTIKLIKTDRQIIILTAKTILTALIQLREIVLKIIKPVRI
jgi:hypothetical protein